jgi:hypothetical protein
VGLTQAKSFELVAKAMILDNNHQFCFRTLSFLNTVERFTHCRNAHFFKANLTPTTYKRKLLSPLFHNASTHSPPSPFPSFPTEQHHFRYDLGHYLSQPTAVLFVYLSHSLCGWSAEMRSLTICLPVSKPLFVVLNRSHLALQIHPTEVLSLDEDTCADVSRLPLKFIKVDAHASQVGQPVW